MCHSLFPRVQWLCVKRGGGGAILVEHILAILQLLIVFH